MSLPSFEFDTLRNVMHLFFAGCTVKMIYVLRLAVKFNGLKAYKEECGVSENVIPK